MLIWGKTRPELSSKYRETVCTGGFWESDGRLVRIYPVPLRYMDDEKIFKKYQWIEADFMKSSTDSRPESYKIRYDSVEVGEFIPTKAGNWDMRAAHVNWEKNTLRSVEELWARHASDGTSLALIRPARVVKVFSEPFSSEDKARFWDNYKRATQQMEWDFGEPLPVRPITPPDYRFMVRFRCDDPDCENNHNCRVLDWEPDALYANCCKKGDSKQVAADKVVTKLTEACGPDKDLYFFMGNISTHPSQFTIVGLWHPKKKSMAAGSQQHLL